MELILITIAQLLHAFDLVVSSVLLDRSVALAVLLAAVCIGSWLLWRERRYIPAITAVVLGIASAWDQQLLAFVATAPMVMWIYLRFYQRGIYRPLSFFVVLGGLFSGFMTPSLFFIGTAMVYWVMRVTSWRSPT